LNICCVSQQNSILVYVPGRWKVRECSRCSPRYNFMKESDQPLHWNACDCVSREQAIPLIIIINPYSVLYQPKDFPIFLNSAFFAIEDRHVLQSHLATLSLVFLSFSFKPASIFLRFSPIDHPSSVVRVWPKSISILWLYFLHQQCLSVFSF
jgi:hypothetical protein